ncbi:MAG: hypothetical protein ACAI38_06735 [Myxococcota bacterium]
MKSSPAGSATQITGAASAAELVGQRLEPTADSCPAAAADRVASPVRSFARILGYGKRTDHVAQLLGVRALEARGKAPAGLVRFGLGPDQLAFAYALQDELMAKLITPSNRLVGWKIGFSTIEGRKPLGISEPAYGPLFSGGNVNGPVKTSSFANLLVEQEVVLVLRKDIDRSMSAAELEDAIGAVHLGFELPSKRFKGAPGAPDGPTAGDMIADCLAAHSFKLGPELPKTAATSTTLDLTITRDGAPLAVGSTGKLDDGQGGQGALQALRWLVEKLVARRARRGEGDTPVLRSGDIVYTGAVPGPLLFQHNGQSQASFVTQTSPSAKATLDVIVG